MPHNLKRLTGRGDLHFITFACYQRRKFLASAHSKNITARILGEVCGRFQCKLIGYVLMPDHVHLLISEPAGITPAKAIQVFKQRVSRELRGRKRKGWATQVISEVKAAPPAILDEPKAKSAAPNTCLFFEGVPPAPIIFTAFSMSTAPFLCFITDLTEQKFPAVAMAPCAPALAPVSISPCLSLR